MSGTRNLTPADVQALAALYRNGLSPRGGIAFDGTASTAYRSTLTGQAIGTDPFSIVKTLKLPAVFSGIQGIVNLSSSQTTIAVANCFWANIDPSGALTVGIYGATTSDLNTAAYSLSVFVGKIIQLAIVRPSSGNVMIYVNGVLIAPVFTTGGTPPTWQGSVTNTYFNNGINAAGQIFMGVDYSASFYNLALLAADVQEIYELGGGVPERFKFGNQTAQYTSDFSVGVDSWAAFAGETLTGNVDGINGQNDWLSINTVTQGFGYCKRVMAAAQNGKAVRLRARVFNPSGSAYGFVACKHNNIAVLINSAAIAVVAVPANSQADLDMYCPAIMGNSYWGYQLAIDAAGGSAVGNNQLLYIKNISVTQVGAVVHLQLNEGIGYQLHDDSTNKLDAVMTTTGLTHIAPQRWGFVRGTLTWAATHQGQSLLGQRCFPDGVVIERITRKPTASSSGSGLTLGTTNSATRWQALAAITANTKAVATLANALPAATADADNDLVVDPDTANFTGSITVEAQYAVTEGT